MAKKLIMIAGFAAAGKTTFSLKLSQALGIPCFNKDLIKIALNRSLPVQNRAESKRLSAAAFDAMAFIAERLMETGNSFILEANFRMDENHNQIKEGDELISLIESYGYQPLTFLFLGDLGVLYQRFMEREHRPERGQANQMWEELSYEDFTNGIRPLGDFNIGGEIIKIDTTDFQAVDFGEQIEKVRLFLS